MRHAHHVSHACALEARLLPQGAPRTPHLYTETGCLVLRCCVNGALLMRLLVILAAATLLR